eukprot:scaffold20358_cov73-Phaeocystis_antarctica.AAC.3
MREKSRRGARSKGRGRAINCRLQIATFASFEPPDNTLNTQSRAQQTHSRSRSLRAHPHRADPPSGAARRSAATDRPSASATSCAAEYYISREPARTPWFLPPGAARLGTWLAWGGTPCLPQREPSSRPRDTDYRYRDSRVRSGHTSIFAGRRCGGAECGSRQRARDRRKPWRGGVAPWELSGAAELV